MALNHVQQQCVGKGFVVLFSRPSSYESVHFLATWRKILQAMLHHLAESFTRNKDALYVCVCVCVWGKA